MLRERFQTPVMSDTTNPSAVMAASMPMQD